MHDSLHLRISTVYDLFTMHEGDIVRYNLYPYGFDLDVIVRIIEVKPKNDFIVVVPVEGQWPIPFEGLQQTLISDNIQEYIYTIAPQTPTRSE